MKKFFVVVVIIFTLFSNYYCFADDKIEELDEDDGVWSLSISDENGEPKTDSRHIICIERSTNSVLYEKDGYSRCAMASTTKILTSIIVLENCDLNEEVEISKKAANTGGSTLGIKTGDKITVESLLYGLLLRSGNDTAVALAEHVSGTVEEFSKLMNSKAKEIGLKNSNFVTPHGLDNDDHYTTAYDMAILTNYALRNEIFCKIVGTKQINKMIGKSDRSLNNTNELLGVINGVYGVKTGFTGNAGRCLITACKRGDLDIIVVVLGSDTKKIRGKDSIAIIEYVFDNFKMVDTKNEIEKIFNDFKANQNIRAIKSLDKVNINYKERENYVFPINKNKVNNLKTSIYCLYRLTSPLKENTVIGKIRLMCENQILYEIDVFLDKKIKRMDFKDYLNIFVKNYKTFYSI